MPDRQSHCKKAERNVGFCSDCTPSKLGYNEWEVVGMFYTCLHYVDAVLSVNPDVPEEHRHPLSHVDRARAITKCPDLGTVKFFYLALKDRSFQARYSTRRFSDADFAKVKQLTYKPAVKKLQTLLSAK